MASYQKEDSPPARVRPLPLIVIQSLETAAQVTTPRNIAIIHLTWVAFLFLLRPGEYCRGNTNTSQHPFRLKDVQFFILQQPYNAVTASNAVLTQPEFVSLLFTTQKNGVKGQLIGHGCTGHPQECIVAAMRRRVAYLRRHGATGKTPISSFNKVNKWQQIQGDNIPAAIRAVVRAAGPSIIFAEVYISAHSLRAGMGMALIMTRVDPDTICLVRRWRRDTILRYLHTTETSFTEGLSTKMFEHGTYAIVPPAHAGN